MARTCGKFAKPQRPQLATHRRLIKRDAVFFPYPSGKILETPAHYTVDRHDRPLLDNPCKRGPLFIVELYRLARRLAVNQTVWPPGIKPNNPVADHLKPDITYPSRIRTLAAIVNLRHC